MFVIEFPRIHQFFIFDNHKNPVTIDTGIKQGAIIDQLMKLEIDPVSLQSGVIGLFPRYINKNSRKARESVENITGLEGVQYVFTGHHGYSADYNSTVRGYEQQAALR